MPDKTAPSQAEPKPKTVAEQRAERLQAALRDNLRRRKVAQTQPDLAQPDLAQPNKDDAQS